MNEGKDMSFTSRNSARWRNNPFYKWHKAKKQERNEKLGKAIIDENVQYDDSFKEHDELNSNIWESGGKMKPEIRSDLLKIVGAFYEFLKIKEPVKDIVLVGSSANFNYTDQSDIDLHLSIDFSKFGKDKEMIRDFMDVKKALWGMTHDITIGGQNVELYVQDAGEIPVSGGIYSVQNGKWLKKPIKNIKSIDKEAVRKKVDYIATMIDDLDDLTNNDEKVEQAENIKNKIKKLRQSGLDKGGEFSEENLAFKVLRNSGYLDKLSKIKNDSMDDELTIKEDNTLDEESVSAKQQKFFGIVRALQTGKIKPSGLSKKVKDAAKNMSKQDVKDFASTKGLNESEQPKREFGCLMAFFDIPNWETKVLGKISEQDLYDEPGFGLEHEPHVTVLYGFHQDSTDIDELKKTVDEYVEKPIKIEIKKVSVFENEKFDVLKFDIESPELRELNKICAEKFEHTNSYKDYHPHMTIAYLKKGVAAKYVKEFKPGSIILNGEDFVYSDSSGKVSWNPNDQEGKKSLTFDAENGTNKLTLVKCELDKEKIDYLKDFIAFVCDNIGMENPVDIFLRNGRDEYIQSTASYLPKENSNHINVKKRMLVDIMRSIAHELTHNRQREIGKIQSGVPVQNIGGEIEWEADGSAGMLIKYYTHDNGMDQIYDI